MHYFGIPTCPYCKKRVNLIRTWSLKRQGEYKCPRCGGISNIFLSPLIHVFAVLAVFSGGALYFFHKFILDDVTLKTSVQILIPFAVFFVLSLFMVYLVKPVIKKVSRAEMNRKNRSRQNFEDRRSAPAAAPAQSMMYDPDEYIPSREYQTGTIAFDEDDRDMKVVEEQPRRISHSSEVQKTTVMPTVQQPARPRVSKPAAEQSMSARTAEAPTRTERAQTNVPRTPAARPAPAASQPVRRAPAATEPVVSTVSVQAVQPPKTVTNVSATSSTDDFFAKYDDPEYIERRLRELKEQNKD